MLNTYREVPEAKWEEDSGKWVSFLDIHSFIILLNKWYMSISHILDSRHVEETDLVPGLRASII